MLEALLIDVPISDDEKTALSDLLGPRDDRPFGATYSDIRTRFLVDAVMSAVSEDRPLDFDRLRNLAADFVPTKPFNEEGTT